MPRVSVILPTFNCARFLGRAISSALAQTYTDYEVVVVDDGSTDETQDVVAQFGSRVRYFYQPNRGPTPARNLALSQASGELIAYLDADDMWYPHKLARQVEFLDAHKECGLVHSDVTIIDEADHVLFQAYKRETKRSAAQGYCAMELLQRNSVWAPTVVLEHRECLNKTRGFDDRVKGAADYYQWLLVAMDGKALGYIDEPLAMYRRWAGNMSANRRQAWEEVVVMFEILLAEKDLALRLGREAVDLARTQLRRLGLALACLDRTEGFTDHARRRVIHLLKESPVQIDLYVELLKSCVPFAFAMKLRRLRERLA